MLVKAKAMNSPSNQIKCILFDLDNTLIGIPNTWTYFDNLIQLVLAENYQVPIPPQEERDTLWRSGKEYIAILTRWGADPKNFWGFFDRQDAVRRKALAEQNKLILYPEVIDTLQKLRRAGFTLGIVSNTPTYLVEFEIQHFNLDQFFDAYLGLGEHQEICKPEPDGIISILKTLKMNLDETLFIGDATVDLVAAKRAGVSPILIDRTGTKLIDPNDIEEASYARILSLDQIFQYLE